MIVIGVVRGINSLRTCSLTSLNVLECDTFNYINEEISTNKYGGSKVKLLPQFSSHLNKTHDPMKCGFL